MFFMLTVEAVIRAKAMGKPALDQSAGILAEKLEIFCLPVILKVLKLSETSNLMPQVLSQ